MNKLLHLIFMVAAIACVYAAVARYPHEEKPPEFADQEGCYLSKFNEVLPVKQPYYPKNDTSCVQYTCEANDGETQLESCGAIGFPPNCRLVKDSTLKYPKCCGTIVCDPTTESPPTEAPAEPETNEGSCVRVQH